METRAVGTRTMAARTTSLFALLSFVVVSQSGAAHGAHQFSADRRGPPAEAYSACENMNAGEQAEFVSPRGETVRGTCEDKDGTLVLRPANRKTNGKRRGPPPEAYTVCEGKNAGDSAQFEDRRGETLVGSCEEDNGKLVLRPDRS